MGEAPVLPTRRKTHAAEERRETAVVANSLLARLAHAPQGGQPAKGPSDDGHRLGRALRQPEHVEAVCEVEARAPPGSGRDGRFREGADRVAKAEAGDEAREGVAPLQSAAVGGVEALRGRVCRLRRPLRVEARGPDSKTLK